MSRAVGAADGGRGVRGAADRAVDVLRVAGQGSGTAVHQAPPNGDQRIRRAELERWLDAHEDAA